MMTRTDMHNLLVALGFTEDMVGGTWRRVFPAGVDLCVDCTGGKFLYKEAGITVTFTLQTLLKTKTARKPFCTTIA